MNNSEANNQGKVNPVTVAKQEDITDEMAQHCSDFLLRTWLLIERMLPEKFALFTDDTKAIPASDSGRQWLNTSYSNFMLFLCMTNTLNEKGNPTMNELRQDISVSDTTATRIVDWMVDSGYAKRLSDAGDRRIVRVTLTETGRELSKDARRYVFDCATEFLKLIPKEVVRGLKDVMERLS